ncbi:hypothetical protein [Mesorhizobium sp. B2-8-9]|uniref:hypothetical protein n=1 Tax=Mesorhizobium sp. B2-8-9 TaxID=2589899 RepID=UPI0015E27438|nr:hypothetical protein [Mesorhizobium sp. B2-8-9]
MTEIRFFRRSPAVVEIPPNILSEIRAGILVCTSPRSGSNHLVGLMASAGLGHPLEWFGGDVCWSCRIIREIPAPSYCVR